MQYHSQPLLYKILDRIKSKIRFYCAISFILLLSLGCNYHKKITGGNIRVSPFFSNNMIIERGKPIIIKGEADPNTTIAVRLENYMKFIKVNDSGTWKSKFPPTRATAKFNIYIEGIDTTITISNVRTGKLIFLAGDGHTRDNLRINSYYSFMNQKSRRFDYSVFQMRSISDFTCRNENEHGRWLYNLSDSIPEELVMAVTIGKEISINERMPVGVVNFISPRSRIKDWLVCPDTIDFDNNYKYTFFPDYVLKNQYKELTDTIQFREEKRITSRWYDDEYWRTYDLPLRFSGDSRFKPGITWFRKRIYISSRYLISDFKLQLGSFLGDAEIYFNDSLISSISHGAGKYSITISDSLMKVWTNNIAIRFTSYDTIDGFYGQNMNIYNSDSSYFRNISEDWKIKQLYFITDSFKIAGNNNCGTLYYKVLSNLDDISFNSVIWYGGLYTSISDRELYFHMQDLFSKSFTIFDNQPEIYALQFPSPTPDSEELKPQNLDAGRYILFQVASNLGITIIDLPEYNYSQTAGIDYYKKVAKKTYQLMKNNLKKGRSKSPVH